MGEAKNRGITREERIAAAKAREEMIAKLNAEVAADAKAVSEELGIEFAPIDVRKTSGRGFVVADLDALKRLLETIRPYLAEAEKADAETCQATAETGEVLP